MSKRKLTKIVKKRRLNYKPTIGLTLKSGNRVSVNAEEYYAAIKAEQKRRVEEEMHKVAHQLIREMLPGVALIEDMCSELGAWGCYF